MKYLVRYRVTWTPREEDKPRTVDCVIDVSRMRRMGDHEERDMILRAQIAGNVPPRGGTSPKMVKLLNVDPLCNCGPQPSPRFCKFSGTGGHRFFLAPSVERQDFELILDRHDDKILATAHNTLSVEFLSMIRDKYDHQ